MTPLKNRRGAADTTLPITAGVDLTIATGKRAIVYADGTNIVRVTADT